MCTKKVGHLQITTLLGKGAFASVYKAKHELTGEVFAVKMVDRRRMDEIYSGSGKNRIDKEKNIMKRLVHPNIVRLFDFKRTTNNYYFVMEYCPNGDLQGFMRKHSGGKFSEA